MWRPSTVAASPSTGRPSRRGRSRTSCSRRSAREFPVSMAADDSDHRVTRRAAIIVLDGLGIGSAPDSAAYGDAGSDTLGNVARAVGGLRLPNLAALGLGSCAPLAGM